MLYSACYELLISIKAKFHYASWFEAGSKLVADRFEVKLHYAIWFEACRRPASNQLRTSFEPDRVMEFGFKRSGMAHVNERSHSFTCHQHVYPLVEWTIPAFNPQPQRVVSPHVGWYSFPVPLRVEGWVGLNGLVKHWGGFRARRRSRVPVFVAAAGNWTRDRRVAGPTP